LAGSEIALMVTINNLNNVGNIVRANGSNDDPRKFAIAEIISFVILIRFLSEPEIVAQVSLHKADLRSCNLREDEK
jgi:hypothetical protein